MRACWLTRTTNRTTSRLPKTCIEWRVSFEAVDEDPGAPRHCVGNFDGAGDRSIERRARDDSLERDLSKERGLSCSRDRRIIGAGEQGTLSAVAAGASIHFAPAEKAPARRPAAHSTRRNPPARSSTPFRHSGACAVSVSILRPHWQRPHEVTCNWETLIAADDGSIAPARHRVPCKSIECAQFRDLRGMEGHGALIGAIPIRFDCSGQLLAISGLAAWAYTLAKEFALAAAIVTSGGSPRFI
ncbi:hypothetical protein MRX96_043952 [Rhipicephalus microplus]